MKLTKISPDGNSRGLDWCRTSPGDEISFENDSRVLFCFFCFFGAGTDKLQPRVGESLNEELVVVQVVFGRVEQTLGFPAAPFQLELRRKSAIDRDALHRPAGKAPIYGQRGSTHSTVELGAALFQPNTFANATCEKLKNSFGRCSSEDARNISAARDRLQSLCYISGR